MWTEGETIISIFILDQFQQVPKSHFSLTLRSFWVSSNMQKKDKQWSLQISRWSINIAIWLDKPTYCDKLWIKNA